MSPRARGERGTLTIVQDYEAASDTAAFHCSYGHGSHYIDWRAKDVKLPKILEREDFDGIAGSQSLFARKFDARKSDRLIAAIEDRLLKWSAR
jgi:hypothetical protein